MKLEYKKSESTMYPELIDTTSSKTTVYLRKNVTEEHREDEEGNSYIMYVYDGCKLTKEEYKQYLEELSIFDIEQQRADIDYIALMTGVDLEES